MKKVDQKDQKAKTSEAVRPKYFEAEAVKEIAGPLIAEHHAHLKDKPIFYLFNDGKMKDWATMSRRNEKEQFISAWMFVMEVNYKQWVVMTEKERIALVDHELCHAGIDPEMGEPFIIDHEVEEFSAIVRRHGFWRESVRVFGYSCVDQMSLPLGKTG